MGQPRNRLDLQSLLEGLCDNVYFQPPGNDKIKYPCIVYRRDNRAIQYADNEPYGNTIRYLVTVIDRNPDSDIPDKVAALPMSSFNRAYIAEMLNHDVYHVYF